MGRLPAIPSDPRALLETAVRRRVGSGATVENLVQATLGGSNRTLLFDLVDGAGRRRLVSREETFGGHANPFLPPASQFRIMAQVYRAGIPVPEPIFEFDEQDVLGPGYVTAFVAGETLPRKLLADPSGHAKLIRQLAEAAARVHAVDPSALTFLEAVPESGDPLAALAGHIDELDEPHPVLELGLRWLDQNRPPPTGRVLVHGDFRNGNFMVDDSGLVALLDWECSHIGSGVEDLGWLCTRSWRFSRNELQAGGFGTREAIVAAYNRASGTTVDIDAVRWWERYGLVRWAMYNILQAFGHERGRRSPAYAACGRNVALIEYDLLLTLSGRYD